MRAHRDLSEPLEYKIVQTLDTAKFGEIYTMEACKVSTAGQYYVVGGMGNLTLVDPANPAAFGPVFDLKGSPSGAPTGHSLMFSFKSGTRLLVTAFSASKLFLLDTTDVAKPVLLDVALLGSGAGGHVVKVRTQHVIIIISSSSSSLKP